MSAISGLQPPSNVEQALRQASAKTGTDFDYLLRTAQRESAFKTNVKAKSSSATGLFQFIEQTWFQMVKKAGNAVGLGSYAKAIERTSGGRHQVADSDTKSAILALRKNPKLAAYMAGVFTQENSQMLHKSLGRPAKQGELYIAHFLGVGGAAKLIKTAEQNPGSDASKLFPKAAAANRPIFYNRSGSARSIAQVYSNLTASFKQTPVNPAITVKTAAQTQPAAKSFPATKMVMAPHLTPKTGQPLNIIPAGLRGSLAGELFKGLYSNTGLTSNVQSAAVNTATISPLHILQDQIGPVRPAAAAGAPRQNFTVEQTATATSTDEYGPGSAAVQRRLGVKPLLHNLFTNGPARSIV